MTEGAAEPQDGNSGKHAASTALALLSAPVRDMTSTMDAPAPQTDALAKALGRAIARVRLLGRLTAGNAASERARLVAALETGAPAMPEWTRIEHGQLPDGAAFAALAEAFGEEDALGSLYAERARELELEVALVVARGERRFAELALLRHPHRAELTDRADAVARSWIDDTGPEDAGAEDEAPGDLVISDDARDPRSLVSRLREEIARARLPFRVSVSADLAPLAATGEEVVHVSGGRRLTRADVERTVLHEIEGHARPRVLARRQTARIFALGSARGTDDQEGRALLLEERHHHLTRARRRGLARRHLACIAMRAGADFVTVVRALTRDHGATAREAIVIGERVFRGSDGTFPGLGRERSYLECYLDARDTFARDPELEAIVARGQLSFAAAAALRDQSEGMQAFSDPPSAPNGTTPRQA